MREAELRRAVNTAAPRPTGGESASDAKNPPRTDSLKTWTAHVDGAARGNPGPAGIGVVIEDATGATVRELGEPLGHATNNVAEYTALIRALEEARALGCDRLAVYTDSELMAHQLNGKYAVKAANLLPLFQRARLLLGQFEAATVTHVRRELNKRADALSNIGADKVSTMG